MVANAKIVLVTIATRVSSNFARFWTLLFSSSSSKSSSTKSALSMYLTVNESTDSDVECCALVVNNSTDCIVQGAQLVLYDDISCQR